mmetsp:Transcript_15986/g.33068  ORF Transcript_15986/g.33068 Transcript_15986/m.33068 type:complete len:522 (-) Transcript_15986:212-1777(-)
MVVPGHLRLLGVLATVGGLCLTQTQAVAAMQEPRWQKEQKDAVARSSAVSGAAARGSGDQAQQKEAVGENGTDGGNPFLVALRREVFEVWHKGKVISYKTSYSGAIHVGYPVPQEFRVVFDTGSGHLVLPSVQCESVSCVAHRRYDIQASETATAITLDGRPQPKDEASDLVTIGFGTGKVKGEFVRDKVCLGPSNATANVCVKLQTVMAIEMSRKPFESFAFDGILGLGLSSLALSKEFSFFNVLSESHQLSAGQFGVFLALAQGEKGDASEIAFGGYNRKRVKGPLSWVPAAKPHLGYWQVEIKAVYVDGNTLDICRDGACTGVMDTGTTHLGIPAPFDEEVGEMLVRTVDGSQTDCRTMLGSELRIELADFNITLSTWDYMRQLPLPKDIIVGKQGVSMNSYLEEHDAPSNDSDAASHEDAAGGAETHPSFHCRPKLMPVSLPAPLGPKLFILGEPVLHRYYTVFDWDKQRLGFGLANHEPIGGELADPSTHSSQDSGANDDAMFLMQVTVLVARRSL